jgi:hypothetical protein
MDPTSLEEISAVPSKHSGRDDWLFTFADRRNYTLATGEARIAMALSGDEVTDAYRWIHVPEEWRRRERDRSTRAAVVRLVCTIVFSACFIAGIAGGIVAWSRGRFDLKPFLWFFALLAALHAAMTINSWPRVSAQFSTAQPWMFQVLTSVGIAIVMLLVTAGAPALIIGFVHGLRTHPPSLDRKLRIPLGLALGALVAGVMAWTKSLTAPSQPTWADYSPAVTLLPLAEVTLSPIVSFVLSTALILILLFAVDRYSERWTRRRALVSSVLLLFGFASAGLAYTDNLISWSLSGLTTGTLLIACYVLLIRFELSVIPLAVGLYLSLNVIGEGARRAFAAALPGSILAAILMIWIAIIWSGKLRESGLTSGRDSSA